MMKPPKYAATIACVVPSSSLVTPRRERRHLRKLEWTLSQLEFHRPLGAKQDSAFRCLLFVPLLTASLPKTRHLVPPDLRTRSHRYARCSLVLTLTISPTVALVRLESVLQGFRRPIHSLLVSPKLQAMARLDRTDQSKHQKGILPPCSTCSNWPSNIFAELISWRTVPRAVAPRMCSGAARYNVVLCTHQTIRPKLPPTCL